MAVTVNSWSALDADAAMNGVDLLALPLVRVLNVVWTVKRRTSDDDEWRKWVTQVTRPLPGQKPTQQLRDFRRKALT